MAGRFGSAPPGIAGENLIVATDRRWTVDELGSGVVVTGVFLGDPRVAAPCLEFTSYLLGLPQRAGRGEVEGELEFLDDGTRGFLLDVGRIREPLRVAVGDEVLLAPPDVATAG
jgi:hypothetical protein